MENQDLIESVLTSGEAFVVPPARRVSRIVEAPRSTPAQETTSTSAESAAATGSDSLADSTEWKTEYDSQVLEWRAQSAEAREKAEKERARWEAIRAEEAKKKKAAGIVEDTDIPTGIPSNVYNEPIPSLPLASAPETLKKRASVSSGPAAPASTSSAPEGEDNSSQKWVEVQAASTTSFPSTLTFPERHSPAPQHRSLPPSSAQKDSAPPKPVTATLAIFDSSLSTKTRVLAILSSLAINLALPFINGVMLGFGEIFAKNIVLEYFGWKPLAKPGSTAAKVGLRR